METLKYKTISANKSTVNKDWLLLDVAGINLCRASSEISKLLRGKHKPNYTPHVDCGDYVIVLNADKINLTGAKLDNTFYHRYSGYVGGHHVDTPATLREKAPERLVEFAVKGMIPRNRLGRQIIKKLKIYAGPNHNHEAQNPASVQL